jgi:cysteinyl-tRNA synthetase
MSASHARVAIGEGLRARPDGGVRAFARHYLHAGMVRLDGEKMSKSLGNLVFVSSLLADGTDPMAIRLAILAHRYRDDWDWTAAGLAAAAERLARWRAAVGRLLAAPQEPAPPPGAPQSPSEAPLSPRGVPVSPSQSPPPAPEAPPPPSEAPLSPRGVPVSPSQSPPPAPEAPPPPSEAPASPPGALASPAGALPSAEAVLAAVRERMADDLDAPGALAAVDRWADGIIAAPVLPPGPCAAALLVRDAADALLGIAL